MKRKRKNQNQNQLTTRLQQAYYLLAATNESKELGLWELLKELFKNWTNS